ncbi:MAG: hypothetical protein RIS26_759 [Actinomycetota bacterium]
MKSRKPYLSPVEFRVFAHRGSTEGGAIENSLDAFRFALDAGLHYLETDVRTTEDGVAVLFHDDDLRRVAASSKRVNEITFGELQSAMVAVGNARVPTLLEALERFPDARFNIDIKDAKSVRTVPEVLKQVDGTSRVLISSFSRRRRMSTLKQLPGVATSTDMTTFICIWLFWSFGIRNLAAKLLQDVDAIQIPVKAWFLRFDSTEFVTFCVNSEVEVHYWTVNEPSEVMRLKALGASGIVTDKGKLMFEFLRER